MRLGAEPVQSAVELPEETRKGGLSCRPFVANGDGRGADVAIVSGRVAIPNSPLGSRSEVLS